MAYNLSGTIAIKPPLNYSEIQTAQKTALKMLVPKSLGSRHATPDTIFDEYMPLNLHIEEFDRTTDEGILKVRQALFLQPSFTSNARLSYDMETLILNLMKALPGHTWSGVVTAIHDELDHAEKVVVDARGTGGPLTEAVRKVKGRIVVQWEDNSADENASDLF